VAPAVVLDGEMVGNIDGAMLRKKMEGWKPS